MYLVIIVLMIILLSVILCLGRCNYTISILQKETLRERV